jgi:hypothetical protein
MEILLGLLLYALGIAWLCALTGANRLDAREGAAPLAREFDEASDAAVEAVPLRARRLRG